MKKNDFREKYNNNVEVLKKLNIILDKTKQGIDTGFELDVILDAIEKIRKEQDYYINQLRKNTYNRYGKKFTFEKKYELYQPEFIERENEIIIQANSIDEYVTEIKDEPSNLVNDKVETTCDDKTDVLTSDKACDDKTDVLTSDKACDDKTDVLTSDKTCDDKTDVLTSNDLNENFEQPKKKRLFKKIGVVFANIAAASLVLIGGVLMSIKQGIEEDSNNSRIESTIDDNEEDINVEIIGTPQDDIKDSKTLEDEFTIDNEDEKLEETDIKIGDVVSFENTDLYYASTDELPKGNTDIINNQNCEVTMISVVYQGQSKEVITDENASIIEIKNEYQEKYGDDVQFFINSNVIDEEGNTVSKNLGWVNEDDSKSKIKVLK